MPEPFLPAQTIRLFHQVEVKPCFVAVKGIYPVKLPKPFDQLDIIHVRFGQLLVPVFREGDVAAVRRLARMYFAGAVECAESRVHPFGGEAAAFRTAHQLQQQGVHHLDGHTLRCPCVFAMRTDRVIHGLFNILSALHSSLRSVQKTLPIRHLPAVGAGFQIQRRPRPAPCRGNR